MAVNISAGDLSKSVLFQSPVITKNDEGGKEKNSYTNRLTTWAKVKDVNQVRAIEANAVSLIDAKEFYLRATPATKLIKKEWLMTCEGLTYTLQSEPELTEDKNYYKLIAKVKK